MELLIELFREVIRELTQASLPLPLAHFFSEFLL